ncbi:hypothetical protein AMTRI_Chr10g231880 [Amborella trichopoda]|uniref:calcium/calmodulin-regulated receptor-like kinase 2 n=1 Tax=Amborella trichopoda TaxID=13333 RepID=UPI0005D3822A|nr:calcium/calmodulin-regulated receptor-like kinase 2 [Amborella trichopoda]XP_020522736.1 calcium/calmodulin-regulated receptor-like kinase 2 [Amborella trichopoda]|eukprot:XP_011623244.1 calcium/calmodulin-regulated receptor-like kinase 2 [Amborella trichopoda]
MTHQTNLVIIGVSVGVAIGLLVALCGFIFVRLYKKRSQLQRRGSEQSRGSLPIYVNGVDSSMVLSGSEVVNGATNSVKRGNQWSWWGSHDKDIVISASGIPRYSYKDVQKATQNFTTILGQGSFGPVYKATMATGEVVAVKVLASNSKQGEKEFQTEVFLLGRLHHRNLVNLVGYCVDKGQYMLLYEYMSNGSLASHLFSEGPCKLSWEERLQIAEDVSHGIEYLHEGAVPPVIHRDIKSANILLNSSMRAKVADFGLSKEEVYDGRNSGLKGTYGYMDPDYMSTSTFTKKSDVYSFGIIMFELITAINPQQGLMDYVNLAAMSANGKVGWDEILDKELVGKCDPEEVGTMASIAYKCVQKSPRKRPNIAEVSQALSRIRQIRLRREGSPSFIGGEIIHVVKRIERQQIELSNMTSIKGV